MSPRLEPVESDLTAKGICSYFVLMPEQYRDRRGLQPYMLSGAVKNEALVQARCFGCSPARWYLPADLIRLYGDIPADNLSRLMRCEKCRAYLSIDVTVPMTAERQKIRLRRLECVWWVKRASWREE